MLKDVGIGLVFLAVISLFSSSSSADWRSEAQVIAEVFNYIEQDYLYPVDLTKCRFDMLKELSRRNPDPVKSGEGSKDDPVNFVCLDRHSGFSTPDETRMTSEEMSGHFGGVGLQIEPRNGKVVVVSPMEDAPAAKAGILAGDIVVAVRQENEAKAAPVTDATDAAKRIRGPVGTKVFVTIERAGKSFEVMLVRADIASSAVKVSTLPDGTGYIRVSGFTDTAADDLEAALKTFQKNGPNPKVILDFRNNPGGYLHSALEMLYYFSKNPDDIMATQRFKRSEKIDRIKDWDGEFMEPGTKRVKTAGEYAHYRVAILVNGGSASASEIFAGTMKDWGFAVVGEKSFGKGVGQSVLQLSDNSSFRLTTFEFLVGNSKTKIQEIGVNPTHMVTDTRSTIDISDEKVFAGKTDEEKLRMFQEASRSLKDNTGTDKDAQFMKARELLK
ncbi:MAG: hypothetical protein A3I44_03860 [Candidatus Sungbacteria bacterium RIFCSPLOWO2_02_FULL_51_17]|uniref:PDZ domain-containing protein n=1 Tax=Candidatus Sungbacteria bacterium RIFCSPHIGHO2_02_FULL_51_29 TaxID=1802273 RepID=A0A1G2KVI6_9BACT|nr:MAG: hypothetical protein A2676_02380 [Candidatus Sungbacteria bacterium RIFCSPHIGHO2_01_FULL_51_22]OHA02429.1 MAG: hypothetical protein A3C16_02220 [Candidatus Sungbacteria bacterium RIFCSPHIGHO2_02_FULL_51_29]OHA06672.1 MAG: hypothetical protein A3B29_03125 [Candidatus Sungbacteria bacterium RIFCSPLOWO2_01_FULL_51_34]OHA11222.1 MAG: hypothetical protein A3I44_03860 [Candidatus Sungbacteria bacterium RIFCSPLOWO2_02_FULL_51_17]